MAEWARIYQETPLNLLPWEAWAPSPELVGLVEKGVIGPGMKALDLGCGLGTQSLYMAISGLQVVGLDISAMAVRHAQRRARSAGVSITFLQGDALNLPLADASFHFLYDRGCFHHIAYEDRETYLREVCRVLQPGGKYQLMSFRHRVAHGEQVAFSRLISPEELRSLFRPCFTIRRLEETQFTEKTTGIVRGFYSVFMIRKRDSLPS